MTDVLDRLCAASEAHYSNPYASLTWPDTVDLDSWFTSPELVSVHGTAIWLQLGPPERRRLSFWEAVNFFSVNIWGERTLIAGLADRLYAPGLEDLSPYLHHMLDEENKHSIHFGRFCTQYAGKVYPDRTVRLGPDPAEAADFLFFARVLIFEEVVDRLNVAMARDPRLVPVARWINRNHHLEETRHLAFGRSVVKRLFDDGRRRWSAQLISDIRAHLADYLTATWKQLYNPAVYRDAGLPEPFLLAASAYANPAARLRRAALSARCVRFLLRSGILLEEPQP